MLPWMMFVYKKAVELSTCYRRKEWLITQKTVFFKAKRLRFQVLFILVSGLHPLKFNHLLYKDK